MKNPARHLTSRLTRIAFATGLANTLAVLAGCGAAAASPKAIVKEGEARAVVVTPADSDERTARAARELVNHIERATGASLPVAAENAIPAGPTYRIYVGDTRAALEHGVEPEALRQREAFAIRSIDNGVLIAGQADFGVYELLDRFAGVRWLWPGELGTHVPKTETLTIPADLDETTEPAFVRRFFRPTGIDEEDKPEFETFGLRHRTGGQYLHGRGHAFGSWWDRYGDRHPEWFRENKEGERVGPTMCVSNSELHDFIIKKQRNRIKNRGHLRLGETDHWHLCQCDKCKSWDEPQPEAIPNFARRAHVPQTASNRYARFWKIMHEKASKLNPDVKVVAFIYHRYTTAPTADIELNENIVLEYVQWADPWIQYFPVTDDAYAWLEDQWLGWRETGATLTYRPNLWFNSYAMPYVNMRQTGSYFQFLHEHGNRGLDMDGVTGNWATRGPEMYLMYRLQTRPEKPIDAILEEYYSGFGPAAEAVEDYFAYWERHMIEKTESARDVWLRFRDRSGADPSFANFGDFYRMDRHRVKAAHWLFPPESYDPAEAMLDKAAKRASDADDPVYAERVEFLRLGLEHAKMCTRLAALFDGKPTYADEAKLEPGTETFKKARDLYRRILAFREQHDGKHVFADETLESYERQAWNVEDMKESE